MQTLQGSASGETINPRVHMTDVQGSMEILQTLSHVTAHVLSVLRRRKMHISRLQAVQLRVALRHEH